MSVVSTTLMELCVAGDQSAWRELYACVHPIAGGFLRHMGVANADLEDALQEVFLTLHRYLETFERRADFKTWLYRICLTQASRVHRRAKVRGALAVLFGARGADPVVVEPVAPDTTAARRHLERALALMTPNQRSVFVLYELHALSGSEIAEVVGCPPATVRSRLREARNILDETAGEG